jgi:hypothetical protein
VAQPKKVVRDAYRVLKDTLGAENLVGTDMSEAQLPDILNRAKRQGMAGKSR